MLSTPRGRTSLLERALLVALAVDLVAIVGLAAVQRENPAHRFARASPTPGLAISSPTATVSLPSASPTPPPSPPPARADASLAYDVKTSRLVLFGGVQNGRYLGDTWTWDGHAWSPVPGSGPAARSGASMTYDPAHDQIVLFGGSDGLSFFNDTWVFDGAAWTRQTPQVQPPGRKFAAMAPDRSRGDVVLYGGQAGITYTSTWTWDGSNWTLRYPAHSPGPRHQAGMAWDAADGKDVLYGGSLPGIRLYDTWSWNGTDWSQDAYGPSRARGWSQLAFDDLTGHVLAFVTLALPQPPTNYFLRRDAPNWTELSLAGGPAPRDGAAVAYDAATTQLVLFGGDVGGNATAVTWTWGPAGWSRAG